MPCAGSGRPLMTHPIVTGAVRAGRDSSRGRERTRIEIHTANPTKTSEATNAEIVGPAFAKASTSFARASASFDTSTSAPLTTAPLGADLLADDNTEKQKNKNDNTPKARDVHPTAKGNIDSFLSETAPLTRQFYIRISGSLIASS